MKTITYYFYMVLAMVLCVNPAFALDSTAPAFNATTTAVPTTAPAAPYLLDSGMGNMNYWYYNNSDSSPTPAGHMRISSCGSGSSSYGDWCSVYSYTNDNKICNNGFYPYIALTPYNMQSSYVNQSNACVTGSPGQSGTRYYFYAYISAINDGSNYRPGTSYRWDLYCYPSAVTMPSYDSSCYNFANSARRSVLLWETGFVNNSTPWSKSGSFNLNRTCPSGYSQHVVMNLTNPNTPNANWDMQGLGICVTGVSGSTVSYLRTIKANYLNVTLSKSRSTYGETIYVGNYNYFYWGLGSFYSAGSSIMHDANVSNNYTRSDYTNYNTNDTFTYQLYCYPPGMTAPGYSYLCSTSYYPFD